MANVNLAVVDESVNSANFSTPRLLHSARPKYRPLPRRYQSPRHPDCDTYVRALVQAHFRCVRLEYHRSGDGRVRVEGCDPRFPSRKWVPVGELVEVLRAVPVPVPMRDPLFRELWDWADVRAKLSLEMTPTGWYVLRADDGQVVKRARCLQTLAGYLDTTYRIASDGEDTLWQHLTICAEWPAFELETVTTAAS